MSDVGGVEMREYLKISALIITSIACKVIATYGSCMLRSVQLRMHRSLIPSSPSLRSILGKRRRGSKWVRERMIMTDGVTKGTVHVEIQRTLCATGRVTAVDKSRRMSRRKKVVLQDVSVLAQNLKTQPLQYIYIYIYICIYIIYLFIYSDFPHCGSG
jgi:hypothetical protein